MQRIFEERGRAERRSGPPRWALFSGALYLGVWSLALTARAQEPAEPDWAAGEPSLEAKDPTRLDVARLPPEAVDVTRDLYAQGLFLEAQLGALGFWGDLGNVSQPGPRLSVALGYELWSWLSVLMQASASFHDTDHPPPPGRTAYEMLEAAAGLRLTAPINARAALWIDGLVGGVWTGGDVLRALGFRDAVTPTLSYGGEAGFDWHVRSRHHSLGVLGGGRVYPGLTRNRFSTGAYGSVYLRYVF
jgi:hypothetical protein